jgi:hypothetical protein
MRLIFLYGQAAAGKLTVAKALSARTGFALFHNHLIVDAVSAVFPFGSDEFVRLREAYWLEMIASATRAGQSLIFTFAPEATVAPDFPHRVAALVRAGGGDVTFVALTLDPDEQERRIVSADRAAFGKLRSLDLLRELRAEFTACMAAMPAAAITIDTGRTAPDVAAAQIAKAIAQPDG